MDIFNNDYDKIKNAYDPMEEFYRRKSAYDEALAKAQAEAEAEMAAEQAAQTSNLPQETSLSLFGKSALRGLLDPFAGTGTYLKEKGFNNGLTNWMAESSYDDLSKGTGFQIGNYAKLDKNASFYDRWLNIGNEATRMRLAENFGSAIGSMANFVGLGKVAGTVAKQTGKALVKAVGKTAVEEGTEEVAKAIAKDGAFETAGKWIKKNAYDLAGGAGAGLYESVGNIGSAVENMRNPNNLNPLTKQPYTEDEIKAAISRGESQIPLDMLLGATEFGAFANKGLKAIDKIQNPLTRTAADVTSRFAVGAIPESYQELLQTRTEQDMYKPSGDSFFSKLSFMPRNAEELDAMIMGGLMGGTITGGIGLYDRYKENKFANEVNAELESNFNTAYSNPYTHANLTDIVSMVEENAPNNPILQSLVDENTNLTFGEKAINYVNALPNIENIDSVIGELPKVDKRQYATDKYGQINELDMLQKITDEYIDEQGKGLTYKQAKDKLSELRNISKEDAIELTNQGLFVPDETLIRHGIKTPNQITAERANELYTIINNQLDMPKINGRNADTIGKNILNIIKSNANTAAETVLSAYNLAKQKGAISEANFVKAIENARNQEYLVDAIEELPKLKELVNEIQNPKLKEELANVLNSSASPVSRSILSSSMADKNVLNNISSMYDKVYKFGVRSSVLPRNAEQARSLYRALRDGGSIKGVEYGLTKTPNGRVISHWNVFDDSMQTGEHEFAHVIDSLLGNVSLRHSQMKDFTLKNIDNLISAYQVDGRMIDGTKTGVISKDEAIQIKNELTNTQDLQQTSLMTRSFVREVLADAKMGGVYIDENGNYVSPDGKTDIVASKIKEMVESHDGMKRFLNWFSEGITEDFKAEIQKTVNEIPFNDSGISFLADAKRQELAERFEIPQNSIIEYGVREILGGYRRQLRKDFISEFKNQGFEFKFVDGTPTIIKGNKELTVFQVLKGISDAKKMFGKDLGKAQEIIQNSLTNQYEKIAYQKLAMKVYWKLVPKSIANILGVETSYSDSLNTSIGRLFMSNSKYKDGGILRGHYTFGGKERYIESSYEFALFAKLEKLQKEGKIQSFFKLEEIPELLGIENRALVEYTKENRERGIYNTDIFAIDNQGRMIVYEVKPLSKIAGEKDISIKANAWIDIIKEYLKDKNEFKNKTDIIHGIAIKKNLDMTKTGKPGEYETYVIRNSFAKTMEKLENKMGWNGKESEYRFYTEKDIQKDLKDGYIRDKAKEFNTKFNMTISEQLNSGKYLKDIFDDVNNRIKKIKSNENWEKEKSKIRAIKRYEEYLNSLDLLYQKDSKLSTADYEQLSDIFKNIERTNYMDNKANVIVDRIEKDNKYAMNFRGYKLYQGTENINVENITNVAEQIRSDGIAYRAKKPGGMNPIAERNNLMDVRDVVFTQNSQQFQRNQDAMQVLRNAGWTERNQNGTITFSRPNPEPSHNRVKVVSGLINNEQKERIVDWKTPKGIKEQVFRMWDNIQTNWVEELQPLKALGRYIPEMYDIYDSAWVASRGWTGKVRALIEFGKQGVDLRDGRGRVNIKSLKEIMKNIDENQLDDFETFTIAKRTIDLANRQTSIQQALTPQEAQIIVANAPQNFVQAQKDLVDLQRYLLRQLVESGIIKESSYAHFINVDPNYIPLFKDFGEEDLAGAVNQINGRSFVNIGSPIKKLKGDTQHETLSPIQSILKHMYQFHSMAERNKVGQKFVGLRNLPHMQDILVQVSAPADRTENVFSVWENGERKYYETTRDLYNALTSINTRQADVVLTMLQKPAHWLRVGATMSPDFAFRNFVRDQFTAWLFTKNGYIPFVDAIRGISHIAKKDDIYQRYLTSGAAHADIVSLDRNYLKKNVRKMVKSQSVWSKVTKNPLTIIKAVYETFGKGFEYLGDLSQNLEVATRVAEFENALKKGKTEERAALESRDVTLDFSRAGTMGKKVNRYIAFFNATIQGGDKFRREIVTRPGTMAFRFGMIALVSAALWYANHDDDRVKELPRWQKDLFWIIPGKDYLVRIPKPFEAGLMFGTGTERFLSYFKDNDPKAFKDFGKALLEGFTPNMMFTALQPIMEVMANYSLFKERNIVPTAEQNYAPYMQFGPYTSETAKMAGKVLNVSPRKIDHLIQGYFGTLGSNINRGIDQGTNAVTGKNMPEKKPNEWIAGLTAFTSTPYASPQSIQDLYERNKELEQLRNEVKAKNKPVKDYPIQEHERIKDAVDALGKLNKLGKEVIKSETLTPAQKREKLDKIKMKELEIAKKALNKK